MKSLGVVAYVVLIALLLFSCYGYYDIAGSGIMVQRELSYKNFSDITVNMHSSVIIRPSATHRVLLTADDNIIDLVTVYPDEGGDKLVFGLDDAFYYEKHSIQLEIEMPEFQELSFFKSYYWSWASGNEIDVTIESGFAIAGLVQMFLAHGDVIIDGFTADELIIGAESDTLRGSITAGNLTLDAGSSDISLTGAANLLTVKTSSEEALVDLEGLAATDAVVDLSGGEVVVNATNTISGEMTLSSDLKYKNNAGLDLSNLVNDRYDFGGDDPGNLTAIP